MTRTCLALLGALMVSACVVPDPTTPGETLPLGYMAPPAARIDRDVAYGPNPSQRFDVYRPVQQTAGVIVFLHGGGWVSESRRTISQLALRQVSRGWVLVSVGYPLSSWGADGRAVSPFPAALFDVKRAIRTVKNNARVLGLDAGHIVVWGESAGGQLAALAATSAGVLEPSGLPPELQRHDSRVDAAVNVVGPIDFANWLSQVGNLSNVTPAVRAETLDVLVELHTLHLGCAFKRPETCHPLVVAAASPHTHYDVGDPPIYLAYGADDVLAPPAQANALLSAMANAGTPTPPLFDLVEGFGHSVDSGIHLGWIESFLDNVVAKPPAR